jgi:hypothetical protein
LKLPALTLKAGIVPVEQYSSVRGFFEKDTRGRTAAGRACKEESPQNSKISVKFTPNLPFYADSRHSTAYNPIRR